ncbi:NADH dehydrogenase [ubiquinone] 1 alpha subcomplex subunit 5 [Pseudolycoriella hygida]|uniref:NADH dehydrogenase [ubiquinone] 1 alpha subcomplex subunit 5 n=1 Tax=Pseudolycoriella hygida TaxID=35572 RepID=A0A9Q0RY38_9DIPT|nr:NADH dehydrogenase [ubiquinone] 1 alpha subcomplex subunit 5 [Pseudolycoriella hygida]
MKKKFYVEELSSHCHFVKSTGLTRLAVSKNPHHTLTSLYSKTMRALAKMPSTAAYRIHTEKIITERAKIVANNASVTDVESKINCGQVEELIIQAENELLLARKMLGWKPWEALANNAPPQQWDWPPAQIKSLTH